MKGTSTYNGTTRPRQSARLPVDKRVQSESTLEVHLVNDRPLPLHVRVLVSQR